MRRSWDAGFGSWASSSAKYGTRVWDTVSQMTTGALSSSDAPMSVDVARRIVSRPEVAGATDDLARVIGLYRVVFQRNPQPKEIQLAMGFLYKEARNQPELPSTDTNSKPTTRLAGKKAGAGGNKRYEGTKAIQNEGDYVAIKPLTPWETYAQALLFSNEASYVN